LIDDLLGHYLPKDIYPLYLHEAVALRAGITKAEDKYLKSFMAAARLTIYGDAKDLNKWLDR